MKNLVSLAFFIMNDSKMLCVKDGVFLFLLWDACSAGEKQCRRKLLAHFEVTYTHMFLSIKYLRNPRRKMKIVPEK